MKTTTVAILTTLLLITLAITTRADSATFALRVQQERLVDVWRLVENFCDDNASAQGSRLRHPQMRVSVNLAQASCSEAYTTLRELDDGVDH
ncbi:hypothetical protein [Microbulbifer sp. SAOS-129_SWC]|uniref:hypothetical protein n=1 Tax=Microbulbifer sp. SAOS-129_SWC TaxID=3145235 RepID=UPI0032180EDA